MNERFYEDAGEMNIEPRGNRGQLLTFVKEEKGNRKRGTEEKGNRVSP
jgi:hypothetical protein